MKIAKNFTLSLFFFLLIDQATFGASNTPTLGQACFELREQEGNCLNDCEDKKSDCNCPYELVDKCSVVNPITITVDGKKTLAFLAYTNSFVDEELSYFDTNSQKLLTKIRVNGADYEINRLYMPNATLAGLHEYYASSLIVATVKENLSITPYEISNVIPKEGDVFTVKTFNRTKESEEPNLLGNSRCQSSFTSDLITGTLEISEVSSTRPSLNFEKAGDGNSTIDLCSWGNSLDEGAPILDDKGKVIAIHTVTYDGSGGRGIRVGAPWYMTENLSELYRAPSSNTGIYVGVPLGVLGVGGIIAASVYRKSIRRWCRSKKRGCTRKPVRQVYTLHKQLSPDVENQ